MTDEELEKEAEKVSNEKIKENHQFARCARKSYKDGFKDGAEFGYNKAFVEADKNLKAIVTDFNKANKWHYVKDELPRKSDATSCERMAVFVAVKVGYNVSTYGTYWNLRLGKFECLDEVYAWCYAPEPPELPKEIEEKMKCCENCADYDGQDCDADNENYCRCFTGDKNNDCYWRLKED